MRYLNLLLLIPFLFLIGCADSIPKIDRTTTIYHTDGTRQVIEEENVAPEEMGPNTRQALVECFKYVDKRETMRQERINNMSEQYQFAAFAIDSMAQVSGSRLSPSEICSSPTNFYDYMIVDTKEANATRQQGLSVLKHLGYAGAAYGVADTIGRSAGDKVSGDKVGRDKKVSGEDMSDSSTSIVKDSESHQTLVGDENLQEGTQSHENDSPDSEELITEGE